MAKRRSDSPLCRRIVLAFLDFLHSVEPAPGVDLEALDVVEDCLKEVFKLDPSSSSSRGDGVRPGLLADFFASGEEGEASRSGAVENAACTTLDSQKFHDSGDLGGSNKEDQNEGSHSLGGVSRDELFGKFYAALDKCNFFMTSLGDIEDPAQVAKATRFFDDAYKELETSQKRITDLNDLAEALKSKGNHLMQQMLYHEAVELYTCAIALSEKNAIYYCNRAAAYTQIQKYAEAIEDCLRSIEIDPCYSKAYSRMGHAYYGQGKYVEALVMGFSKALQLDPNNASIRENIEVTKRKIREQHQEAESDQNGGSSHGPGSSADSSQRGCPFASFPLNASIPPDLVEILRNITTSAHGQQPHESAGNGNTGESDGPEIRMGANVRFNISEMPEQISDALRSVIGMFPPQHGSQGDVPRDGDQT